MKNRGFTLVEMLVVTAIISMLASIVMSSVADAKIRAQDNRRLSDFASIRTALELYQNQYNAYPPNPNTGNWANDWVTVMTALRDANTLKSVPLEPTPSNTYYYYSCDNDKEYRMLAFLQVETRPLQGDLDGNFATGDNKCEDSVSGYCIGSSGWCY